MGRKSRRKKKGVPKPASAVVAVADWDSVVDLDEARQVQIAITEAFGDVSSVLEPAGRKATDIYRKMWGMPLKRDMPVLEEDAAAPPPEEG